jgi:hypothetical protein
MREREAPQIPATALREPYDGRFSDYVDRPHSPTHNHKQDWNPEPSAYKTVARSSQTGWR